MFKSLKSKKWTSAAVALLMALNLVTPGTKAFAAEAGDSVNIELLATSDLHGKFFTWDYATNKEDKTGSMAQLQTILKGLRSSNPNSILVDAGDTIQGNSSQLFLNDPIHPMMLGMNEMGYDTWSFGNHEFNYGVPTLKKVAAELNSKTTALCANVYEKDGTTRIGQPYKIVERPGLNGETVKVAILGMVTPNIVRWDAANLKDYVVTNPIDEAKKLIPEIKKQTDIIIAVVHMSENNEYDEAGSGTIDLANACPDLTAIVAAHEHKAMDGTLHNNILTTENKNGAATLAKMNLKVVKQDGKYVVADKTKDVTSKLIWVQDQTTKAINYEADPDLTAKFAPFHERAKADAATVIGTLKGGDLVPANEVTGIPSAQVKDTAMIDFINEVQMYYAGARVASSAMFNAAANIKEGQIQKSGSALIYPYDNTLYKLQMNGKQLKEYMEWSAKYYNQYKPGDLTISFNQNIRAYNYDMFSGVKYDIDISQPEGSRIKNLTWSDTGKPVQDTETFIIAVNNYRSNSHLLKAGEVYKAGEDLPKLIESDLKGGVGVRDLIGQYIQEVKGGTITPKVDNNWKIIGNNWDAGQRALAVKLINGGTLKLPTSEDKRTPNVKSITWDDVKATGYKNVDIVSFNDFHGSLKEDGKNIGAAKLSQAINDVRNSNPDTIVVSGGDIYQGSAMSNLKYGKPVSDMLAAIRLDASAVGNHEFDWGLDWISQWAKDGNFDFLASNIYSKTTGEPVSWAKPYKIIEKGGIKVGLIGLATPETAIKTKPENVKNIEFRDPVKAANEWAAKLKSGTLPEGKADVVIALTHLGAAQDSKTNVITGEAADLANAVTNVDGIIAAHTHLPVSGTVNNVPIVEGYYNGRSLARLTIHLDPSNKVIGITPSRDDLYTRVSTLAADPVVKGIVDKYTEELKPILDEIVGSTDMDLTHDKDKAGVSILGQWTSGVMKAKAGTQIGIINGGGLRIPLIAKGDITMGKMYELMPFDNTLVKMELKGSDLKRVLENAIGNTNIGWGEFTGVKVYYDINKPLGSRILGMYTEDGTKIDIDKYYTVVTNDFMATGGDGYDFTGAKNVVDTNIPIRDVLVENLKALKAAGKALSVIPVEYAIAGQPPVPMTNDTAKVVEAVKNAAVGSKVTVDITDNAKVSKDIFNAIKGQDKTIVFQRDGVTWTFNGKDITSDVTADIDLSLKTVSAELKNKEEAKIKAVVGKDVAIVPFSFNYDGPLPGTATVKVFIGKDWANKAVYINRYYADKNTYEIITDVTVDADGYITFTTNHCSDYFVMEKSAAPSLPKTGSPIDFAVMLDLGALIAVLGGALMVTGRRKRDNEAV